MENTYQVNPVMNYTLNDYLNLMITMVNYLFAHHKVNDWVVNMSERSMYTYIQVNLGVAIMLFSYSYVCFYYNDFVRGLYTTMLSFLCFYNVFMIQVQLFMKNQNKIQMVPSPENSDDSDVSDDEEGEAFEQELQKERSNDNEIVAQIVEKVFELVGEKESEHEAAQILAEKFTEATTENEVAEILTEEFSQKVVEDTTQDNIPDEEENQDTPPDEKEEQNSVSGTPEAEDSPTA